MRRMKETYQGVRHRGQLVAILDHGVLTEKRGGVWYTGDRPVSTLSNEEKRESIRRFMFLGSRLNVQQRAEVRARMR